MTNIIFLDIDGPICSERSYVAYEQDKTKQVLRSWDPIAIRLIDRLCLDFDMKVVISSTWRKVHDVPTILLTHGFRGDFHEIDYTPDCPTRNTIYGDRNREILLWIERHLKKDKPHKILCIDDMESGESLSKCDKLKDYSIFCDVFDGFSYHNYLKARTMLKNMEFIRDF